MRSVLRGLVVLRWVAWTWAAVMTIAGAERLEHPGLAVALLAAAFLVNVVALTVSSTAKATTFVSVELVVGFLLLAGEGLAFEERHAFAGRQGLAGGWPVVGVIAAGITLGPLPAAIGGALVGTGRIAGAVLNGVDDWTWDHVASLASTVGFYATYGGVSGWVGRLLHRAERERAREEVARTLHDGVLQTLAVVERRVTDPELARLVRDTERDLRLHLEAPPDRGDLRASLLRAATRAGQLYDLDVEVVVVDDVVIEGDRLAAIEGAVHEAVVNVGKHAEATRAVVFAEQQDGGTFVSVRDDGRGFDGEHGHGLRRSIAGRIADVGGRTEVVSRPGGGGTEVRLWVP